MRVIREEANPADTKLVQDRGGQAEISAIRPEAQRVGEYMAGLMSPLESAKLRQHPLLPVFADDRDFITGSDS